MRARLTIILLMLTCVWGGGLRAQGDAGQAGEFLRWGVGAKALGIGRAFTSIADDASALYWNPAGMASLSRQGGTFMFMHLPLREGASLNYLAGAIPLRLFFIRRASGNPFINAIQDLKLGLGVAWHSLGNFEFFDANASPAESNSDTSIDESAVYLSAAYPLNPVLSNLLTRGAFGWARFFKGDLELGLTAKFVRQNLFGERGSTTSYDLGLKYTHVSRVVSLGFALRDFLGSDFSFDNKALVGDNIPANGMLGISITPPLNRLGGLTLSFDYGVVTPAKRDRDVMFGMEYDFSRLNSKWPVKLRFGTNSNQESFTVGLNFSPAGLLDRDWAPSGDWTYANERSGFDATGARFSFSVDKNPFTARYWYENAMAHLPGFDCGNLTAIAENERLHKYFENAQVAKNPGDHAYRYEAALRLTDLEFLSELLNLQSRRQKRHPLHAAVGRFDRIVTHYEKQVNTYLRFDYGKSALDETDYFRSFAFYVQALILAGDGHAAFEACADSGRSWGRGINVLTLGPEHGQAGRSETFSYLYAYAMYKSGFNSEAVSLLESELPDSQAGRFFLGQIRLLEGNYAEALKTLDGLNLNESTFPENLYLPITSDCTFGDEILFLRAAATYKQADAGDLGNVVSELAKIPRFFPGSDLGRFLTNGQSILPHLIDYYERNDTPKMRQLIERVIDSYIKTFSGDALIEQFYTFNYR